MAHLKKTLAVAAVAMTVYAGIALAADEKSGGGESVTRRLSQEQYRQVVADLFGPSIKVGGRFEPDIRRDGLLAMGASQVAVTASGLEEYDKIARNVAAQVVSEQHRDTLIPCKPAKANAADDECAAQFLGETGKMLYRRPLTPEELQSRVKVANDAAVGLKDFYSGLGISLSTMLVSPKFLFRQEVAEADPDHAGQYRMDAYSKASQLSFFLWNAAPDPELLVAAEHGDLNTEKGLTKQVDRMIASPRLQNGVRAFFTDMLGFDEFETLAKNSMIFPKFNTKVARDSQEQTLRTITNVLLTEKGDYRDIFTTRKTFLSPLLASVYSVPFVEPAGGWGAYEFPEGDSRVGIVSQVAFVALHSHPGRSSPTLRGKAVREVLLCQKVPTPPANVNFTLVQDTKNPQYKTARARLHAHATDATCAGCHKIMDPIGLGLEAFNSGGSLRSSENGETIDTSGELDGMKFADAAGLAKAVHDDPAAPACVVSRASSYGLGRMPDKAEGEWVKTLQKDFQNSGYKFPALLREIATSQEFYRVAPPQMGAIDMPASKLAARAPLKAEVAYPGESAMIPMHRVNRRGVLRGMMGGAAVSVGLPFLDCFLNTNGTALANGQALPVVFGTWFWGLGLNPGRWEPNAPGKIDKLGVELQPVAAFKDKMNVFSGMKAFLDGKPNGVHFSGVQGMLTGTVPRGSLADKPSVDTLIADVIGTRTRFRSLEVACAGNPSHSQSRRSGAVVNPAEISPAALYTRVFGPEFTDPNAADFKPDPAVMVRRSALSAVADDRQSFEKTLGAADKSRLDEYFTSLRELEQQLDLQMEKPAPLAACTVPGKVEVSPVGTEIEIVKNNHKLFAGLLAHAVACGQTQVVNVAFSDATSSLRRAGGTQTHHEFSHEEPVDAVLGYQPTLAWFFNEIMGSLAVFLTSMDSIKEGDKTLLDRMAIMTATDLGYAKLHGLENMPMMTFGSASGRLKTGLHIAAQGEPTSRLGLTLQQAMGVPVSSWGTDSMQTSKTITEIMA